MFVVCEVILVCSVVCWLVSVVLLVELVLLFVRLAGLSDCVGGVSCLLVGFCFGMFLSLRGDRGVNTVNLFCVVLV